MQTIEAYVLAYQDVADLDLVADLLAKDGADGATITRVIRRLRSADPRDFPGTTALYQALHRANPHLAHEFHLRFVELARMVERNERPASALDDLFRHYTQELALVPEARSAGIAPPPPSRDVTL